MKKTLLTLVGIAAVTMAMATTSFATEYNPTSTDFSTEDTQSTRSTTDYERLEKLDRALEEGYISQEDYDFYSSLCRNNYNEGRGRGRGRCGDCCWR